jgi:beta-N-acetylhexosaminidase
MRNCWIVLGLLVCLCGPLLAKDKFLHAAPVALDREGEKWADKTLEKLSLEEKVGQMLMVWARGEFLNLQDPEYQQLREELLKYHLGGFGFTVPVQSGLLKKSEPFEAAALINELQRESKLPLIFAADFERGVAMRLNGATEFPQAMAFGAAGKTGYSEQFGRITAEEARAIGVEWNWFPVVDVNSNPNNPIINTRAFGGDPQQVGQLITAYIHGARAAGMLTTAKHFPGHGDTDTDSHLGLARVGGDRQRLDRVELPPFRAAIAAGVDAVLVAHVTVPALDPDPNHVATNSPYIIQELLQKQLGFKGIVVTDALDMNGLLRLYSASGENPSARAAIEAVKAGNDIVLLPADLDAAYHGLIQAVRNGELSEERIDLSVRKILRAKAAVGLNKARFVDLDALPKLIGSPQNLAVAQQVADAAVTLVRDTAKIIPLHATPVGSNGAASPYTRVVETSNRVVAVVLTDDLRSDAGRVFERQLRARVPDANVIYVDENTASFSTQAILATVERAERVLVPVYSAPVAGKKVMVGGEWKNTISLGVAQSALLRALLDHAGPRTIVLAMGNPYLATDFPEIQTYLCTFSNVAVSEVSAVKALFGEIAIGGRLPVDIPGIAQHGEGLDRAARIDTHSSLRKYERTKGAY